MAAEPIIDYTISDHAAYEIERRGIKIETIDQVLKNPDQRFDVRPRRGIAVTNPRGERRVFNQSLHRHRSKTC